jgi:CBS domain containing-hemolysin-like protein
VSGVYHNIGHILFMLLLLVCSAFFSGAETAFFNLSRRQIKLLQKSEHHLQKLVGILLNQPKKLLGCLLLGNMTVNVLFFAAASILTVRVGRQIGPVYAALAACLAFSLLVLFGEILPKSVSYANSRRVSVAAAVPAFMCLKVLTPIILVFRLLIVEPTLRLLLGPSRPAKAITTDEFKSLIEHVRKRGLITADENRLLGEIIELSFLKVRHVMRPRVDMITCSVTERPGKARELMQKNHLTKLPVYVGTRDNIVGLVSLRRLLLELDKSLDRLVQEVHFVPEQKTVESLLEFFRRSRSDTAIVVDEYGGIAGSIRLEDIAEELFGPIEVTEQIQPIEQIGPFEYRLAGHLAIHDWADVFSIDPEETRISTVGGLVTAALGKIPKAGDIVYLKNLKLTVERVRKHRIETLILSLSRLANNAQ